ncbi:tRNA pseudouridine(38-40) synthase TruA [Halocalculus aciditolerans]|uniref:tRNA pseudouridine synthase A n=1 Tax=Halocalculus aciditolerans TaxID=1383812 RepID=A0A830F0S0_9EURY|nr:tRNA pseudouridine(38-40) synthase TruA [Halocalculus aciditolerans]GGL50057.1 tRNA pseudouridine(38-40) synthase TruA [Halocalculus aciditolerans]
MLRRAFRVAYDGRPYYGFQRQPSVSTVEDAMFDALRKHGVLDDGEGAPSGYAAAGRTDAGVSARAQTVAFDCPEWLTPRAFNGYLPESIYAYASADVPGDFHATHHARSRSYEYHLYAPESDAELAAAALDRLRGEHDFHNLTPDDAGTVRDLDCGLVVDGDYFVLSFEASGFPRALVRRATTLVQSVASGAAPLDRVDAILGAEPVDGRLGVPPAPAFPLFLADVAYDVEFTVDERALRDAREAFETASSDARTRSRVYGRIAQIT